MLLFLAAFDSPLRVIAVRAIAGTSLALALMLGGAADAAPIAVGSGPGASATTSIVFDEQGYGVWFLADLSDPVTPAPIPIFADPAAGPWNLQLGFDDGYPDLVTGDQFILQELVSVASSVLASWSQEILTSDWRWVDAAIFDNDTSFPLAGLDVFLTDQTVTFAFDPLSAGAEVFVVKVLEYVGTGVTASSGGVAIAVVPEPGTAALLVLGTLGLSFRSRHRDAKAAFTTHQDASHE